WSMVLLLGAIGALGFVAVGRAQTLPRAARVKKLVRAHTDARHAPQRQRQRPTLTLMLSGLDQRLRGMRRFARLERLVERAAVPVSASTIVVGSIILGFLVALFAAVVAGPPPRV